MTCYTSRLKLLGLFGLSGIMVTASFFCTTLANVTAQFFGWIGVGFFGLGLVAIPWLFLRTGPQIVIDQEGIEDRRMKIGVIRWEDMRSLWIGSVNSVMFLCVDVVDPETYLSRMPRWKQRLAAANAVLGFPALTISFSGINPGLTEVWTYLHESLGGKGFRIDDLKIVAIDQSIASIARTTDYCQPSQDDTGFDDQSRTNHGEMLSWSNQRYKLTLGIGCLGIAGLMLELRVLSAWLVFAVAFLPLVVFVFVHPGEVSNRFVRLAHVAASVWYLVAATVPLAVFLSRPQWPKAWVIYPLVLLVGCVPCLIVLSRTLLSRYGARSRDSGQFEDGVDQA